MSKGSPVIPVRIPADLLARIETQIAESNPRRREEPWTRSSFILAALEEKLAKMERSRRSSRIICQPAATSGSCNGPVQVAADDTPQRNTSHDSPH